MEEDSHAKLEVERNKKRSRAGILCVIGCSLSITVIFPQIGALSLLWGTQVLYVASYYHHIDNKADIESMYLVFPLAGISFSGGSSTCYSVLMTHLYHLYGARKVIIGSTLMVCVCLLVCSFIENFILFIIVYAILEGLGCSGIVFPCMYPSWYFFPTRKGTVTGIIVAVYGVGCAVQGLAFTWLMNPNNESPTLEVSTQSTHEALFDYSIAQNYPFSFRIFALVFVFIGIGGAFLITEPKMTPQQRKTVSEGGSQAARSIDYGHTPECPNLMTALKTWTFICLFLLASFGYTFDYYMLVQYKTYASPYIRNDHLLSIIGSISQVGNIIGRLTLSILIDFIDNRILMFANPLANSILSYTIKYMVTNEWLYTLWMCLSLFCFGFCLSPTAVICGKIYGSKTGGTVFSFVMIGLLIGNLSTIAINSGIQENYGYDAAFTFMSLTALCVSILALTTKMKYTWEEETEQLIG